MAVQNSVEENVCHRKFGISTANVLHPLTIHQVATMPVSAYVDQAKKNGFDGVEVWPMNPWLTSQLFFAGIFNDVGGINKSDILSAHQSPRQEKWRQLRPSKVSMVPPLLMLPSLDHSIKYLDALVSWKPSLPVVLYEQTPPEKIEASLLSRRLIQIRRETVQLWGVTDLHQFIDQLAPLGFTGVCFDWTHFKRARFGDWRTAVSELAQRGLLREVHLSVGRTDLGNDIAQTSIQDLNDLLHVVEDSEIIKFLKHLNTVGFEGSVVVELLPSAIKALRNKSNKSHTPWVTKSEMNTTYQKIRQALYANLEGPLAG